MRLSGKLVYKVMERGVTMANEVEPKLIQPLYDELQKERFVTLASIDHQTGGPNVSALSWLFAKDESTINFAVDNRSRILENIRKNNLIVINLNTNESSYAILGEAVIKEERIKELPLKLALIEVAIKEVRDVMFYGSKIITDVQYDKTYDKTAAEKLDRQVMEAIKKA